MVEAPYDKMNSYSDFDTWFWLVYVRTSSEYRVISELFPEGFVDPGDLEQILAMVDVESILVERMLKLPEIHVGDVIQLRMPYVIEELSSSLSWSLKYFYEHRFKDVFWLLDSGVGGALSDVFGGVKSKVIEIVKNEEGVIEKLVTDLFLLRMPFAFQRYEFKVLDTENQYKSDLEVRMTLDALAFFENSTKEGILTPAERDLNQIRAVQSYFIARYQE